jgi:integrase
MPAPRKRIRLTKTVVDAAKHPGSKAGPLRVWDQEPNGFFLVVYPNGTKSFKYRYTSPADGREREYHCGDAARVSVQAAREDAKRAERMVHEERRDPNLERSAAREEPTVSELANRYLSEHAEPKKKAGSVKNDRQMLREYILPMLGKRTVSQVTRQDVLTLHRRMRATPVHANRTLGLLSKMFNLAERWELRPSHSNPCYHVEKYPEKAKERILTGEELLSFGEALSASEQEDRYGVAALRLLVLTGMRPNEVLTLRWDNVRLAEGLIFLPDSKVGRRTVAVAPAALDVLNGLPRDGASPYVIPGIRPGKPRADLKGPWRRVRKAAGLSGVRLYDLRHSYATEAARGGASSMQLMGLLGHKQVSTTLRYTHLAAQDLHQHAARAAATISAQLERRAPAEILAFPAPALAGGGG